MKCICGYNAQENKFTQLFIEGERIECTNDKGQVLDKTMTLYMCPKCHTVQGKIE